MFTGPEAAGNHEIVTARITGETIDITQPVYDEAAFQAMTGIAGHQGLAVFRVPSHKSPNTREVLHRSFFVIQATSALSTRLPYAAVSYPKADDWPTEKVAAANEVAVLSEDALMSAVWVGGTDVGAQLTHWRTVPRIEVAHAYPDDLNSRVGIGVDDGNFGSLNIAVDYFTDSNHLEIIMGGRGRVLLHEQSVSYTEVTYRP